jgi:hypothetical protein
MGPFAYANASPTTARIRDALPRVLALIEVYGSGKPFAYYTGSISGRIFAVIAAVSASVSPEDALALVISQA